MVGQLKLAGQFRALCIDNLGSKWLLNSSQDGQDGSRKLKIHGGFTSHSRPVPSTIGIIIPLSPLNILGVYFALPCRIPYGRRSASAATSRASGSRRTGRRDSSGASDTSTSTTARTWTLPWRSRTRTSWADPFA